MDDAQHTNLKSLMKNPQVAWPTLLLAGVVLLLWGGIFIASTRGFISATMALILNSCVTYCAFTPLHEATHRSVTRIRWINEVIGRVMALLFLAPFPVFRWMHLEHHRHTNDPERDPDIYSGSGNRWLLPLRWLTQDLHYYQRLWRERKSQSKQDLIETWITVVVIVALVVWLLTLGYGISMLVAWIVPCRIAMCLLAFSFDYLPHVPHRVLARDDRYRATRIILFPGLTALMLYQNYHLIHHLYPGVPFYRYWAIFNLQRPDLESRGTSIWQGIKKRS